MGCGSSSFGYCFGSDTRCKAWTRTRFSAIRDRLFERSDALTKLTLAGGLPPEDLWPAPGLLQLFGAIARIGATAPWLELTHTALRDGWSAAVHSPP